MAGFDWGMSATLMERQDGGSDMYVGFDALRSGTLGDLVRDVAAMSAAARARLVIDAGTLGTFNVADIIALSERDDFPG